MRFDGTVSLGNLLVVLALVISAVIAWTANRERSLSNAAAINRAEVRIEDHEIRLRALEITAGRIK